MERKIVIKADVIDALKRIGVKEGDDVIVHTSLKNLGYVCGGAQVIIEALTETIGKAGTIMMPTQTWKNLDPSYGVHWEEPEEWWDLIRENWPAYDKDITPTNTMGAVSEMFRRWPEALRSDHPVRSFAAWGKKAEFLTSGHGLEDIFGNTSPVGKLYDLDGYVLMIGVGYDKNTSFHLADERAKYQGKRKENNSCAIMREGRREWITYETLYVDGEDFDEIGAAFEESYPVKSVSLGNGTLRYIRQRDLVDFAVDWIEENRNVDTK